MPTSTALTVDRIVAAHQKIKRQQRAFAREVKEIDDAYDAKINKLESHLLGVLNRNKQDSFKAAGCSVYRHKDITPTAADWPTIYKWIVKSGDWEMLEKRLKKTFVATYMEEHKGAIPPGVSVMEKYVAKVRVNPGKRKTAMETDEPEEDL